MRRVSIAAGAAAIALSLAGCSIVGTSEPTPSPSADPLASGVCLSGGIELHQVEVEAASVIDCAKPHRYELLARQDVPLRYFPNKHATLEDRERLQRALDGAVDTIDDVRFRAYTSAYCTVALQQRNGLSEADFGGESARSTLARVATDAVTTAAVLNQGAEWDRQPLLACLAVFNEPVKGQRVPQMLTRTFGIANRQCINLDAEAKQFSVPCTEPHLRETAVILDATTMLEEEALAAASQDASQPFASDVQSTFDEACSDALEILVGDDFDEDHIGIVAVRGAVGWGDGAYVNEIACQFVARGGRGALLPPGSLFGIGDKVIKPITAD